MGSPPFSFGRDSFFCPTLDIERQGERLRIAVDDAELDRFLGDVLS